MVERAYREKFTTDDPRLRRTAVDKPTAEEAAAKPNRGKRIQDCIAKSKRQVATSCRQTSSRMRTMKYEGLKRREKAEHTRTIRTMSNRYYARVSY